MENKMIEETGQIQASRELLDEALSFRIRAMQISEAEINEDGASCNEIDELTEKVRHLL